MPPPPATSTKLTPCAPPEEASLLFGEEPTGPSPPAPRTPACCASSSGLPFPSRPTVALDQYSGRYPPHDRHGTDGVFRAAGHHTIAVGHINEHVPAPIIETHNA